MRKNQRSPFIESSMKGKAAKANATKSSNVPKHVYDELTDLISWNIKKVIDNNKNLNLKSGLIGAQDYLALNSRDGNANIDKCSKEQQHLICALLAWQQLGNKNAESLHKFIESQNMTDQKVDDTFNRNNLTASCMSIYCDSESTLSKVMDPSVIRLNAKGPVVKLPLDTKIIMRVDNVRRNKDSEFREQSSLECCMESACAENLSAMDQATEDLRKRAANLAQRETKRVELLERAELAWGDLELAYQRRLTLAEEKNEELSNQLQLKLQERNASKEECPELVLQLKKKGQDAENQRVALKELQKEVCARACTRLKLSEEVSKGEAMLAQQQCKLVQADRDLKFKEEQAKRKLILIENETDSACALMHDAERAMHAELSGLRDQIQQVSDQLLAEDEINQKLKNELTELRKEKAEICEDLDGCKVACDAIMQSLIDEVNKKRMELEELKEKVMECRCKLPVNVAVEVKRTPSLAALCSCAPEDRIWQSCSCSSLRTTLISTLLADLFGGLQSELSEAGFQMPCHLMKCLDDKHNWDRASVVKTNLRNFFSQLLVGELDIAIASSIEKYHAKWIGASCADAPKMIPGPGDDLNEGWEQRALERRAKQLAEKLAEELFQERADEITKRAKEIVKSGPPPCDCGKKEITKGKAVLPCLVTPFTPFKRVNKRNINEQPTNWKQTNQAVAELKNQVQALQMATINKDELMLMEEHITNTLKNKVAKYENAALGSRKVPKYRDQQCRKKDTYIKNAKVDVIPKGPTLIKNRGIKKRNLETYDASNSKKYSEHDRTVKHQKKYFSKNYAVNICLCGKTKSKNKILSDQFNKNTCPVPGVKSSAPIKVSRQKCEELNAETNNVSDCPKTCSCLHKEPSNKSLDLFLEKITEWKGNLEDEKKKFLNQSKCNLNSKCLLRDYSKCILHTISQNDSKLPSSKNLNTNEEKRYSKMSKELSAKEEDSELINNILTTNTASVYMAHVNLDKSNELLNKEANSADHKEEIQESIPENKSPDLYVINNSEDEGYEKTHSKMKSRYNTSFKVLTNSKSIKTVTSSNYEQAFELKKKIGDLNDKSSNVNELEKMSNNFDYYVHFLGVTMAEVDNGKIATMPVQKKNWSEESNSQNKVKHKPCNTEISNVIKEPSDHLSKELTNLITSIFNDQLNKNTIEQKDIALDSRSLDDQNYSLNNCVCCNNSKDGTNNLEVNTFDLLENHLKEKLYEFKNYTCKSSCVPPEAEKTIFSTILKKVRKIISDSTNGIQGSKSGALTEDGSWRRVYGLLQEYLKVKLKRVKCLPISDKNADTVLPIILDKISNLIEQDFQRLKDICQCTNTSNTNKNILLHELPEKDTYASDKNYENNISDLQNLNHEVIKSNRSIQAIPVSEPKVTFNDAVVTTNEVTVLSTQNSPIILTQNISAQVYSNVANKCCDIMEIDEKSVEGIIYNKCTCYSNTSYKVLTTNHIKLKSSGYTYPADRVKYDNNEKRVPKTTQEKNVKEKYYKCFITNSVPLLEISKKFSNLHERAIKYDEPKSNLNLSKNTKSLHQNVKREINDSDRKKQNIPLKIPTSKVCIGYMKNGRMKMNKNKVDSSTNDNLSRYAPKLTRIHNDITCATETNVENIDDMVLILTDQDRKKKDSTHHQSTDTYESGCRTEAKCMISPHWFENKSVCKPNSPVISNSICLYESNDNSVKLCKSDHTVHYQNCICNKVPVCHVKMLLNNIENDIMMSRCTCDMMSTVCPVHIYSS